MITPDPPRFFLSNFKSKSLLVIFFCVFQNLFAQTPDSLLAQLNRNNYPEKIYIQYDKPAYFAGETIWFKAYLMEGLYPATKSTVVRVELLNENGQVIDKKTLPILSGAAAANFLLPADMQPGNYAVRAYTRRHMNNGAKRLYYHALTVYSTQTAATSLNAGADSTQLYFFPEGGNFITGLKANIAFRCTDKWGYPKEIEGKIKDSKGTVISSFKSTHNGMGKFIMLAQPGEKYVADCIINSAEKMQVPLPGALGQGVSLQVTVTGEKTFFNIDAGAVTIPSLKPAYILGVQENMVAFKIALDGNSNQIKGSIPIDMLPSGILQITLFNADNKPLAERLLFVNSGDYIPAVTFKTDTLNLDARKKNVCSFKLQEAAAGTYGVSVTAFNDDVNSGDNIVSRLLLTDDIKGFVYNPAYYFEKNDEAHAQNLDLVMLTNGWRRYNWDELVDYATRPPAFKDPDFITFSATAINPKTQAILPNRPFNVYAKTKDNNQDILSLETDSTGSLIVPGLIFEDTLKLTFTNAVNQNDKMQFKIKNQPIGNLFFVPKSDLPAIGFKSLSQPNQIYAGSVSTGKQKYSAQGILMKDIVVTTKAKSEKQKFEQKYTSSRLGSNANQEIDLLTDPPKSSGNILEYLKSRIAGVSVSGGPIDYQLNYRGARSLTGGPIPMAVFLDEFQVEPRDLSTIRVEDVAMVKVFSNALSGAGGSLAIYTKRDREPKFTQVTEKAEVFVEGFSPVAEFFSPKYDAANAADIISDKRVTLYWNPYLATTAQDGKLSFSFYNSDDAKQFKVVIEGVLEDGKLLHIVKILK